jgi:LPXTG-motif cell wall-anchored protein
MAYTKTLKPALARYGSGRQAAMSGYGYPGRVKGGLQRYRGRNRGVMSGLGDDICTPYGGTLQADGTCSVGIAGAGSGIPIQTTITGTGPSTSSSTGPSWFDSLMKGFANVTTPGQQPVMVAPQSGISTTTVVLIGAALVGAALLMKKRD